VQETSGLDELPEENYFHPYLDQLTALVSMT
jgi:hypothetical protein